MTLNQRINRLVSLKIFIARIEAESNDFEASAVQKASQFLSFKGHHVNVNANICKNKKMIDINIRTTTKEEMKIYL